VVGCGFLVVKLWWIAGESWEVDGQFSGSKNMPLFPDLFLRDSHFGNFGNWFSLILSVSENGYGERIDVGKYRLQPHAGRGVINTKPPQSRQGLGINPVDETSELMVISQFGKIIGIDNKSIRAAGRSTPGVELLDLEPQDKVAAAVVIPPEEFKSEPETGTLLQ
jgi:DNA gyrase/topoisomerase IV subunit A